MEKRSHICIQQQLCAKLADEHLSSSEGYPVSDLLNRREC